MQAGWPTSSCANKPGGGACPPPTPSLKCLPPALAPLPIPGIPCDLLGLSTESSLPLSPCLLGWGPTAGQAPRSGPVFEFVGPMLPLVREQHK